MSLTLHHPHDFRTVNEIFCRGDYEPSIPPRFVVDVGANIGISGAFFLTRDKDVRCHLIEPDPRNVARLRKNLEPFVGRWTIEECAVADFEGGADFGIEESGRYGALDRVSSEVIGVRVKHVNTVLESVLEREPQIDLLKIDIEGWEERVIDSISHELLARVRYIILEGRTSAPIYPDLYSQHMRGECTHLVSR